MLTIKGLYNRVKELNIDEVIDKAFDGTTEDLAEINSQRMLDGVKSDGSVMPDYSYRSVVVFGKEPGPIILKDTGAFQQSIIVKRNGNIITTKSTDSKNDLLVNEYGEEIFGTGGNYKKEYLKESLRPALNKEIKAITGLKFGK